MFRTVALLKMPAIIDNSFEMFQTTIYSIFFHKKLTKNKRIVDSFTYQNTYYVHTFCFMTGILKNHNNMTFVAVAK